METAEMAKVKGFREVRAGKYLTFRLSAEEFGVEIVKVQEIVGVINVTRVPQTPAYVRGVINLRGRVIPVVDLRVKFGMERIDDTDRTCIVVVQITRDFHEVTMAVIVDEVSEVLDVKEDEIDAPPEFGSNVDTGFIIGMGKVNDKVLMLLDIDMILSSREIGLMDTVAKGQ
ncbi:MAG: purine-binding chemotaxis protein CheW [Deltaproteobacteria bacterium]|nr:purine-binding chemotaxis protein CheW [Deltaproteobacteria bacterium]